MYANGNIQTLSNANNCGLRMIQINIVRVKGTKQEVRSK